ncbi:MAG: HNH endonuclease [Prevotellaceae bacterium]|nr:HNH endonuclease [Prevotellaceae bacterium]
MRHSYRIYATLLDSFQSFVDSDKVWERYWGFSENPPMTEDAFRESQRRALLDRINRVPFDSAAADRGTAFNEIVDCMVEHRTSERMEIRKVYDGDGNVTSIAAALGGREFAFPVKLCEEFAGMFRGALTQYFVTAPMETRHGTVELYGYIDELMPQAVHDIKTTGSYRVGKFKDHSQHLVYPYCLYMAGSKVTEFHYNIVEFSPRGVAGVYDEAYSFVPERDVPVLRDRVEGLVEFMEENRDSITDRKVFGGENVRQ